MYLLYANNFYVFLFVIGLVLSILLHEFWHLLFAKLAWVEVVEFSIGFWEKIAWFKWRWIEWNLRNILLGGFVRFIDDYIKEFQNIKKYKKLYHTNNTEKVVEMIMRNYTVSINKLYIAKKYWQKFLILTWWVLMNLMLAVLCLIPVKLNLFHVSSNETLTKKQITGLTKIYKENSDKELDNFRNYIKSQVPHTIWLGTAKTSDFKDINVLSELGKWIAITYYSFKYSFVHPEIFKYFQSIIGLWKNISLQEKYNLMNLYILLFILALVNISLFFVNILPLPALDGGVLFKETVASVINKITSLFNKRIYYDIVFHKYIVYSEFVSFYVLTLFWIVMIIKDLIS